MHPPDLIERLEDPHRRLVLSDRQEAAGRIKQLEAVLSSVRGWMRGEEDADDLAEVIQAVEDVLPAADPANVS